MSKLIEQIDLNEKLLKKLQKEAWALYKEIRDMEATYTQYSQAKTTETTRKVKAGKERFLETLKTNQRLAEAATDRAVVCYNKKLEEYQTQYEEDRDEIVKTYLAKQTSLDAEEENALEAVRRSFADKRRKLADDEKKTIQQKESFLRERTRKIESKIELEKKELDSKIQTYFLVEMGKLYEDTPAAAPVSSVVFPPIYYKKKAQMESLNAQVSLQQKVVAELQDRLFPAHDDAEAKRQRDVAKRILEVERQARLTATAGIRAQVAEENRVAREAQKQEDAIEYALRNEILQQERQEADEIQKRNNERAMLHLGERIERLEKVLEQGYFVDEEDEEAEEPPKIMLTPKERKLREEALQTLKAELEEKKNAYRRKYEEEPPCEVEADAAPLPGARRVVKLGKKGAKKSQRPL